VGAKMLGKNSTQSKYDSVICSDLGMASNNKWVEDGWAAPISEQRSMRCVRNPVERFSPASIVEPRMDEKRVRQRNEPETRTSVHQSEIPQFSLEVACPLLE
jgi:hypothetical protein